MDYLGIVKKAFQITIKHRYLWIFGILAGGISGGIRGLNISLPNNSTLNGDKFDQTLMNKFPDFSNFWTNYWGIILGIIVVLIFLGLIMVIISIVAQGALLGSIEAIEKKQTNNFWNGVGFGFRKFWSVLGVGLIFSLIVILSLAMLIVPIILFVMAKIWVLAIIYGLLICLVDLVLWIFMGIISPFTLRLAVLGNLGVWGAIRNSWPFFIKNWKEIVVILLITWAIGLAIGIGFIMIFLLVGGLLFGIGFAIYLVSMTALYFYAGIFGLAFLVFILILGGIVNTFISSIYTLVYLELYRK
ncbi:MAG: hypothetical protein AAB785_01520 [Patescibacteria group bacterium]